MRGTASSLALCLALAACAPAGPELECGDGGAVTVVIGAGDPNNEGVFRALHDGDSVSLTSGPQGGQHVWIQTRATGINGARPRVSYRIARDGESAAIGLSQYGSSPWRSFSDGAFASQTHPATIDDEHYCSALRGALVRIRATVDDRASHCGQSEVTVRVQGWSADTAEVDRVSRDGCCADFNNQRCYPSGPPDAGRD